MLSESSFGEVLRFYVLMLAGIAEFVRLFCNALSIKLARMSSDIKRRNIIKFDGEKRLYCTHGFAGFFCRTRAANVIFYLLLANSLHEMRFPSITIKKLLTMKTFFSICRTNGLVPLVLHQTRGKKNRGSSSPGCILPARL